MKISMIGTLPPITSISAYCLEQVSALGQFVDIQFINFKSLYPKFLFKWVTEEKINAAAVAPTKNVRELRVLTWYNPFSWIYTGFLLDGDIVHFHWWTYYLFPVFFVVLLIAKLRKKKIICTLHNVQSHETNYVDWFLTKIILSFAQVTIVHSGQNQQDLITRYHIPFKRTVVIRYGVLTFYKTRRLSKTQARKRLNISLDKKVVLFFGCIRKYKGLDILIRAFSIVKKTIPQTTLLVAGECWEDWDMYASLINQLHLGHDVIHDIRFIPTDEVQYYYAASDLLVLPYNHFESQSGPGTIGLAFGKPMIVSDAGSLPLLVKDKNCVISTHQARDYAKAILMVLQNKRRQRKLENDAQLLAVSYSTTESARMTYNLYRSLCENI